MKLNINTIYYMKKTAMIILVLTTMLLGNVWNIQSKRLVLFEQFTNTACGPCAKFTPSCDSLLMVRLGDVVSIKYHFYYPAANDPFYLQEQENLYNRSKFYNVSGVPACLVDGTPIQSSIPAISSKIDELKEGNQKIDLQITSNISDGKLLVNVNAKPLESIDNENLRLFVCIIEEEVIFDEPVPNGETEFRCVLKKFLPDSDGYNLGNLTDTNKTYNFETEWEINGFYDESQLAIIAFIQDINTHEVYETSYAPRSTDDGDAAKIILVEGTPTDICMPMYNAKVMFRNLGYNNLTNANICVDINGYIQKTPWTGNLGYLENTTIETPMFTDFALNENGEKNNVSIYISDINNTSAQSPIYKHGFNNSVEILESAQLTIYTDNKPEETTWKLYDSFGDIVQEGGPYSEKRTFIKIPLETKYDDCYRLVFMDSGADGIVGDYGNGYYKLEQIKDGKKKIIIQSDYKNDMHQVFFKLKETTAVESVSINDVCFYNASNKTLETNTTSQATLTITDISGYTVYTQTLNGMQSIDISHLRGYYIINIATNDKMHSRKIAIF